MKPFLLLFAFLMVCPVWAEDLPPQLASIAAQRGSVERQFASAAIQVASVQRQRESVRKQAELVPVWKTVLPEAVVTPAAFTDCDPLASSEAEPLIASAADHESLPPELLRAVIKQESGFKPCAVSTMGAQGLMQLMPDTAYDLHVEDPFDPAQNIRGGAAYLKQLVNRYGGDLRRALSAYNAGMARADIFDGVPDVLETQRYVGNITRNLGYSQLPVFTSEEAIGDLLPAETITPKGNDFHRLVLPPVESVFVSSPDFKRFR